MKGHEVKAHKEKITPKVNGPGKTLKYIVFIIFIMILVILGRGFFTGSSPHKTRTPSEPKITTASTSTTPLNLEIPMEALPPKPIPLPGPKIPLPPPPPPSSVLSLEKPGPSASEQTRLKSPSMIYGSEAKPGDTNRSTTSAPINNLDPNSAFAQQTANAQVVTVNATHNTNTNYKILQGKLISAVLESSINSDMPGMVRAVVSKDVYSDTGRVVLLPRGTRLIGQYNSGIAIGQTRVMIVWARAITPQHVDIALGSPSTDNLGRSGMTGDVDTHFWQIFGNSALLSVLGAAVSNTNVGPRGNTAGVLGNPYQMAMTQGLLNASNEVLQSRINVQPTIRIDQGAAIQVFVARDLDFSNLLKRHP